ncbi:unnamed protein product [Orchesella dallaii]|uniref:Uncharacterized protein n=1 Tax=Orchesella dallaii TaxID=48710 RepID=A0ABP1PNK6_9HEXA
MKTIIQIASLTLFAFTCCTYAQPNVTESKNQTVHLFVLMIPDWKVEDLQKQARLARQEEVATGGIGAGGDTATYVGQIVSGVLGGDVRSVLAGTAGFLPEGDIRESIGGILITRLAPVINNLIREATETVARRLNETQTTTPVPSVNINKNTYYQQQQQQQPQFVSIYNQNRVKPQQPNFNQYELPRSPPQSAQAIKE